MIHERDIRVGNYFKAITGEYVQLELKHFACIEKFLQVVEPIPLDSEISGLLPDFDFGENFMCDIANNGLVWIEQYGEGPEQLKHIKYMHQYQNLYQSLSGSTLDLIL